LSRNGTCAGLPRSTPSAAPEFAVGQKENQMISSSIIGQEANSQMLKAKSQSPTFFSIFFNPKMQL
jgi:hypothetical protein